MRKKGRNERRKREIVVSVLKERERKTERKALGKK